MTASWTDFTIAEPGLAQAVEAHFTRHSHHVLATSRADGSPPG